MIEVSRPDISVARVYDSVDADGTAYRVLVDRLWPRGLSKAAAPIDAWLKDVAPSTALRRWYGHVPERFDEFGQKYLDELQVTPAREALLSLAERARAERLVLMTATRDVGHSAAAVLRNELASVS